MPHTKKVGKKCLRRRLGTTKKPKIRGNKAKVLDMKNLKFVSNRTIKNMNKKKLQQIILSRKWKKLENKISSKGFAKGFSLGYKRAEQDMKEKSVLAELFRRAGFGLPPSIKSFKEFAQMLHTVPLSQPAPVAMPSNHLGQIQPQQLAFIAQHPIQPQPVQPVMQPQHQPVTAHPPTQPQALQSMVQQPQAVPIPPYQQSQTHLHQQLIGGLTANHAVAYANACRQGMQFQQAMNAQQPNSSHAITNSQNERLLFMLLEHEHKKQQAAAAQPDRPINANP